MDGSKPESVTQTLSYEAPNQVLLLQRANSRLVLAEKFVISNDVQLELAAEERKAAKNAMKQLEEKRVAITAPLDVAKKAVMDLFRAPQQLLQHTVELYDDRIRGYQEQRAAEAAEARRTAEKIAQQERERIAAEAAKLQAEGNSVAAVLVSQTAAMVVAQPPPAPVKTVAVQMRESWEFEIVDPTAVPREYLSIDETKIRGVVRSLKGATNIAGVMVYRRDVVANSRS